MTATHTTATTLWKAAAMKIEIKHRFDHTKILWSGKAESVRDAVLKAIAARADLAGADLAGAYLADAYLADANLAGANLAGANLAGAYLAGAYLAGANLADANLAGAYLADANLAGAYLARANLAGANLAGANLAGAYLAGANLAGADLAGADLAGAYLARARNVPAGTEKVDPPVAYKRLAGREARLDSMRRYRERNPDVPVVEGLDAKILAVIDGGLGKLDMTSWHSCETTHCRAGWAIHLAGEKGYALERELGDSASAGRAIYRASTGRSPFFYASNERALEDLRRCAAEDAAASVESP